MTLPELYAQYGELVIQAEIIQARLNESKRLIALELNKQKE